MPQHRRQFIRQLSGLSATTLGLPLFSQSFLEDIAGALAQRSHLSPQAIASDESFWYHIQKAYKQSPHFINLENGYFSPQPEEVLDAQVENIRMINEIPSFYMRKRQHPDYEGVKLQLAELAGCSHEEIAITRNTTESLNTVVMGMDFKSGEEVILCDQDYGSMQEQFQQQARRHGIVLKYIELPLHPESDQQIVDCYEAAITDQTRVMLVTQLINITGQVLPVRKIADMAHGHGVEVIVDGAHAFGHLDFKIPDLGGDYYGASLHKWLCCPLGTGLLYMKKKHIPKIWPLYGDTGVAEDDIRKFEQIGTRPSGIPLTIANAIRFHQMIGSKRKEARLRYLRNYWIDRVKDLPKVKINSPFEEARSCAIGNVAVEGLTPKALEQHFYDHFRIYTVAIDQKSVKGVRVTPHLYTTLKDLDKFVEAIEAVGA